MKPIILLLILLTGVFVADAADPRPAVEKLFALYPTIPDDPFHRQFATRRFEYENALTDKPRIVKGFFNEKPVLTFAHIARVDLEGREIQTAPITGLRFVLNDSGVRLLRDYLRQPNPKEMVVFIDGYAYATVSIEVAREITERRVLWIIPPRPQEQITERFLTLLAEKLQSKVTNQ